VFGQNLQVPLLPAYLLSGGSPAACAELGRHRRLPEWIIETGKSLS
jgi:hypothetical protein